MEAREYPDRAGDVCAEAEADEDAEGSVTVSEVCDDDVEVFEVCDDEVAVSID